VIGILFITHGKVTDISSFGELMRNMVWPFPSPHTGCVLTHFRGPVVRFGPNSISINSNTALKTIYGHKSNVKKSQFYSVFPPTKDTFNTHSSIDKAAHARKRRVLSHAFSDGAIKSMEKYVLANVRTFCSALGSSSKSLGEKGASEELWSAPQNMSDWCNYLTFDVMGDLCFGKAFEMLEHHENRHVIELIGNAAHMHLIVRPSSNLLEF
jgi:cytochrome P450